MFGEDYTGLRTQASHMSHSTESEAGVTDRMHDNSWSANLEQPEHAEDPEAVIEGAVEAIEHTTAGNHVNLVTHGSLGHPETYLYDALDERVEGVELEFVERCGCGGYVLRAHVGED